MDDKQHEKVETLALTDNVTTHRADRGSSKSKVLASNQDEPEIEFVMALGTTSVKASNFLFVDPRGKQGAKVRWQARAYYVVKYDKCYKLNSLFNRKPVHSERNTHG